MALVEGVKYGLSTHENYSSSQNFKQQQLNNELSNTVAKKSVIFVKLTDSALKAIEDYLQSQKTGDRATLQFLGNEGRINIPSSNPNVRNGHAFDFSLSSNADIEGPQGSFECIQQTGSSSLESMGALPFKMRIHAKDDVYEATKQRISVLEMNRQHECAKEIKPNSADIGRQIKKRFNAPQRHEPSPKNGFSSQKKSSLLSKNNHNSSSSNLNNHNRISNGYYTNHNHSSLSSQQNGRFHNNNNNDRDIKHEYNAVSGNAPPAKLPGPISSGGDITRKPLRDRIIHLLAVKPYKKPELINRLMKEGLKAKDRRLAMPVLLQVSNMKGNEYFLNRGIWNDVQEYWPFYTDEERQVMKRRKPQNLTPPGSDCSVGSNTSGSSMSPSSSTSTNPGSSPTPSFSTSRYVSISNGLLSYNNASGHQTDKRTGDLTEDDIPIKKQRISHFVKENVDTRKDDELVLKDVKPVVDEDTFTHDKLESNSFLNKYTTIRTPEQRARYKTDFNNEYEHYRSLHSVIDKVAKRFAHLQELLNQEEVGTEAFRDIKEQIVGEYNHNKKSRKYQEARRNFTYLHEKLSYIKRLVSDYDMAHSTSASTQQSSISSGYGSHYEDYLSV